MSEQTALNAANSVIDRAAQRSDAAIQAGADAAHQALAGISETARRLQADASQLSQRGMEALRDSSRQVRESAQRAGERTVVYIQDQPVKSVLIAAAAGAALMAVASLFSRSRG